MDDVKKSGYLRKQKSMRRRFFVLRGGGGSRGPARLEYYENEKKFRLVEGSGGPRGTLNLEETIGVNKRADAKRKHLLVLYTRDGGLTVSAEGEEEQEEWYGAIMELLAQARCLSSSPESSGWPGPAFREVWQVSVRPRGLGQSRNLSGIYRLCLTERTLSLVRLRSDAPSVTLQLMNVRRCGHSDNYFFVEVGRSAVTGPGELWMQVEDSVVAQNMHETILEAMKSLSEEFRPRTKSQSLSSTPITVPSRRHLPNPPPPSQVGFSRRSRAEANPDSSPAPKSHSSPRDRSPRSPEEEEEEKRPRTESAQAPADNASASSDEYGSSPGLFEPPAFLPPSPASGETNYISMAQHGRKCLAADASAPVEEEGHRAAHFEDEENYAMMGRSDGREAGYMPMLPGTRCQDYMPMTPNSISPPALLELAGYVMMSPLGSCSPEAERTSWPPSGEVSVGSADSRSSDYMNMWPLSRSASSTPPPPPPPPPQESLGRPSGAPASYRSLPRSYKMEPAHLARNSGSSSSDSLEEASAGRARRPLSVSVDAWRTTAATLMGNRCRPPSPGEYVSIHFRGRREQAAPREADDPPQEYIAMEVQHPQATNGDYTEMALGLHNAQPQAKPGRGAPTEKVLRPITESLFVSMPTTETKTRPAAEKPAKAPADRDFWAAERTFRQKMANARPAPEVSADEALGLLDRALAGRPAADDGGVRSLATAVAGCGLHKGVDRTKPARGDPPARSRHCSDALVPPSCCNGSRSPAESGLNYIDLDLAKDGGTTPAAALMGPAVTQATKGCPLGAAACTNMYASIDFQMSGELRRNSGDGTEC